MVSEKMGIWDGNEPANSVSLPALREDTEYNPQKPIRLRIYSPLGFYPQHSITIPGGPRLLVHEDLLASAIKVEPPEAHGFADEHFSDLEFLAFEEIRFLAAIALAVHPEDGRAYTYPLPGHVDVVPGLDSDVLLEVAKQHVARVASGCSWWQRGAVLPPAVGGPAYRWCKAGIVNVARVLDLVHATQLSNHLLMRGLGALLRADMCWQHCEIAEAAVIQLHIALEVSFQMVCQIVREERGILKPTAFDAGEALADVFNPEIDTIGKYFQDYYEARNKTMHPLSRSGVVFPVAPLQADDYYDLHEQMVEVYHWLITNQRLERRAPPDSATDPRRL